MLKRLFNLTPAGYKLKALDSKINQNFNATLKFIPQPMLQYLEVYITEHCNLNCKHCAPFSPIAKKSFYSVEIFKNDMERLSLLSNRLLCKLRILGGEPLLHPELEQLLKIARENFPNTSIDLVTNAILLPKQKDSFWQTCKDYDIAITPTKYPIKIDFQTIENKAKQFGVKYKYNNGGEVEKRLFYQPLDLLGTQNPVIMFAKCAWANGCIGLDNGKLYTCPYPRSIKNFNTYFKTNLIVDKRDYIDIYEAKNMDEILRFLAKPIPFCRYCDLNRLTWDNKWERSKKDISEWS
ncbi:hypothetical protein CCY99_04100 [Helicobacter sp. 16-1353]|uniref:radical SAM protein n=1 Tax=Helicobacter sp. 16-1353 TaxID=2004996 RepID=UPI000DCAF3D0|nr:radical SAM protein [Helicobacter sp. 16-1353]RAX54202.1 hypothetical protein CCY99_04100 [Helicobacter sp. 16-1353]